MPLAHEPTTQNQKQKHFAAPASGRDVSGFFIAAPLAKLPTSARLFDDAKIGSRAPSFLHTRDEGGAAGTNPNPACMTITSPITPRLFPLSSPNHAAVRSTAGSLQTNAFQRLTVTIARSLSHRSQDLGVNFTRHSTHTRLAWSQQMDMTSHG